MFYRDREDSPSLTHMFDLIDACRVQAEMAEDDPLPAIRFLAEALDVPVREAGGDLILLLPDDGAALRVDAEGRARLAADAGAARRRD